MVLTDGEDRGRCQYRQYKSSNIDLAFNAVLIDGLSIRKAAERFQVPFSTLQDRTSGRISIDCVTTGGAPVLNQDEEKGLVDHLNQMASFGYGYTRAEVTTLATDLAIHLGKRSPDEKPFTFSWFYGFMKRWPELNVRKPKTLEIQRAKATSEKTVTTYFDELEKVLSKYDLMDSPHRIYNVDEKGLVEHHIPPSVVSSSQQTASVVAARSSTTTVLGCGNALGHSIPPFFVFKGKRMRDELMTGATHGAAGTVSDSGWSNSEVFKTYLKNHFAKYAITPTEDRPLLILYDGHKSHVSISLIEWARQNHMILFVLPAHTSHVLQPMDVGCFGPFSKIYNTMRHKYIRDHATSSIPRHSVCELGCQAYIQALSVTNLQSSFRKCGIFPFDRSSVMASINFKPSTVFKAIKESSVSTESNPFLQDKLHVVLKEAPQTKKRRVLSAVVGGRAITEDNVLEDILAFQENQTKKTKNTLPVSPKPSTSGITVLKKQRVTESITYLSDSDSDGYDVDDIPCCVCNQSVPDEFRQGSTLKILNWAQCTHSSCDHWVHLRFCTSVSVVRRHSIFICPCHSHTEE